MLFMHGRSLLLPLNTVAPTLTGSLISGQVLSGADGSWSTTYAEIQYRWLSASAPYDSYSAIGGAYSSSYTLTGTEIGKRVIRSARVRNGDGFSAWADSAPSAIVQDSPALPLSISGTAPTSAFTDSPYSFTVTGLNGDPGALPKYTFALVGTWPSGASITPNAAGDQATISGPFTSAGSYGGLSVRVTDHSGNIASLSSFTLTVTSSAGILKVSPGAGWNAVTTGSSNLGSPSAVGYTFAPQLAWTTPPWQEYTGEVILELLAFHTGPQSDFLADGNPLFGIDYVEVSADNGTWVRIPKSFDPITNRWGFRFRIDAADWPDGTPGTSGTVRREIRARAVPKNGNTKILQTTIGGDEWSFSAGLKFCTNANGTLNTPLKYVATTGNDTTGDGSSGNPYRTIAKAVQTVAIGGGRVRVKSGEYVLAGLSSAGTNNYRWLTVEADTGATAYITDTNSSVGLNHPMVHLKNLKFETTKQVGAISGSALWLDNCTFDRNARTGGVDWVRVCTTTTNSSGELQFIDTPPYRSAGGASRVFITGGSITNWPFVSVGPRLVKDLTVGRMACDVWSSSLVVLNSSVDTILSGRAQSSPGVDVPGDTFHADFWQLYRTPRQPPITDYPYGGIMYNVTANTGRANAQGPFFKDNTAINNIYMINVHFVLDSTVSSRNIFYLHSLETMKSSMFYNVIIDGGINDGGKGWSGPNEDVIAIDLVFFNVVGGNTNVPGTMLNYTP